MQSTTGRLSVVIPSWSGTLELAEMAYSLANQIRLQCDELIISEDGFYNQELQEIADIYLIHDSLGHGANLHLGLKASSGDYVALLDSDIIITNGSLRSLCVPGKVVCPREESLPLETRFKGWFLVSPREYLEKLPPYDLIGRPEGIDQWSVEFSQLYKDSYLSLDTVRYTHLGRASYRYDDLRSQIKEYKTIGKRKGNKQDRWLTRLKEDKNFWINERLRVPMEIVQDRHKTRLFQDNEYRALWENE